MGTPSRWSPRGRHAAPSRERPRWSTAAPWIRPAEWRLSTPLPIVNLERRSVVASFRRSYQLVRGHSWRVFTVALGSFAVPALAAGAVAAFTRHHTDGVVLVALGHATPAVVLMPIAALPIVIVTFDLVDLDTASTRDP
jgi:hypothetical protein